MAIQQGNLKVVTNNLQLYYNRENQNSFRGESTINFFSFPGSSLQKEGNHATSFVTNTSEGIPGLVVEGNKQVAYAPQYITLVASGAWAAESNRIIIYPRRDASGGADSYAPSGTYRISFYARSLSGNTALGFAFYSNVINNTANLTTKWQRFSANSTYNNGAMIIEFGNINAGGMVCQIACIQVESKSYATPYTSPTLWSSNLVNVITTSGHTTITKNTAGDSWVNARVYSSEGYTEPCYVSFKASQTNLALMISLNTNPVLKGVQYSTLDYAWHPTTNGLAYIYESGTDRGSQGSYTSSTIFEIIYDGVNINYYMDGVLKRSVARSSKSTLYLDSSFYSNSSAVNSLTFGPLSRINRFSNYAVGGGGLLDMSGNGYQADLNSSAITFDSGGFYFNGDAAGVITVPVTNSILDTLSNVTHTYEVWFKLLGSPAGMSDGYFFGRQGYHEGFAHFKSTPATFGVLTWYNDNNNTGWLSYPGSLNVWYHAAYVVNVETSTRQLYVNGTLYSSSNLTGQLKQYVSGPSYYYHFGSANPNYSSNIILSSAKAYNRALTAAEILQNFNATRKTYNI
jgi:hypothetical protein